MDRDNKIVPGNIAKSLVVEDTNNERVKSVQVRTD